MDENDDHWKEILGIARSNHTRKQPPVTELNAQEREQLDANVLAHIDQQFNLTTREHGEHAATKNHDSAKSTFGKSITAGLQGLKEQFLNIGRTPALALTAIVVISFGLLINSHDEGSSYLDIPDSLLQADLDKQLVLFNAGQRALTSSSSQRREAFVFGTVQADLDVAHKTDNTTTENIINNHADFFTEKANAPVNEKLALFQQKINALAEDEQSQFWISEGYLIEMIRLSSLHALNNAQISPLKDALDYFQNSKDLESGILSSDGLNPNYINNRNEIIAYNLSDTFVPDEIQQVIDLTQNLQVLAQ